MPTPAHKEHIAPPSGDRAEEIDKILRRIAGTAKGGPLPAIVATGGYGKGELAPYSDIDVLFLSDAPLTAEGGRFVEKVQATCWEAGLKPACAVRTLDECAGAMADDLHFLTSLLDRRLVWGDRKVFAGLDRAFDKHKASHPPSDFITAKLAERDARHRKMGDTRYRLEPNVKENKGGLRDIQTLLWLSHYLYGVRTAEGLAERGILTAAEAKTLDRAHAFFWTVRCHLHRIAGRADDRLSFDVQPEVAALMGHDDAEPNRRAEKFMKDYFLMANEVGHLTRILCAALETEALAAGGTAGTRKMAMEQDIAGFTVRRNRLALKHAGQLRDKPSEAVRLFRVSQKSGLDIHPDALRVLRRALPALSEDLPRDDEAHGLFLHILLDQKQAEQTLRRMNEAGLLGALIPAFGNIVAHMQYDMYHVFTADEHTLRAVGMMHKIEDGELAEAAPLATALFKMAHSRRALYAAMFLHDIAKGTGGSHAEKGAAIARELGPRLGLTAEETETAAWLVENHLLMTMTAFHRDLNDAKTVADFNDAVQSPERLKLLTVLTAADIMAVGPDRWNNWKSGLLSELYHRAAAALSGADGDRSFHEQSVIVQKKVRRMVGGMSGTLNYLVDHAPAHFWQSFAKDILVSFISALHKKEDATVIRITPLPEQDFTEVLVHAPDRKGLFATLSGALAAGGASIVGAHIFTLSNGMALDIFQVQNLNGHVHDNAQLLQRMLKDALAGKADLAAEIAARQKALPKKARLFSVQPRVIIDNAASAQSTVIEINGKDRPGLLHDITAALTAESLQISAAKISTFGSRAVDVFYVRDGYGLKVLHHEKLRNIEASLKAVLERG